MLVPIEMVNAEPNGSDFSDPLRKMAPALALLLRAHDYASRCNVDSWSFATETRSLDRYGLELDGCRWLALNGYLEHAAELTDATENVRRFEPEGQLTFGQRSCCILTLPGAAAARGVCETIRGDEAEAVTDRPRTTARGNGQKLRVTPLWNGDRHELSFGGNLVKCFRLQATLREAILAAFEERGWPERIRDPLRDVPVPAVERSIATVVATLNSDTHGQIRFCAEPGGWISWHSSGDRTSLQG